MKDLLPSARPRDDLDGVLTHSPAGCGYARHLTIGRTVFCSVTGKGSGPRPRRGIAMAFCTKCGTQFESGAAFCGNCGAGFAVTSTFQPSFIKDAPQTSAADVVTTAEMKFIGNNYEYFNRKWKTAEQKKSKQSWNWAAFFLTLFWMGYRKMYIYCWFYVGIIGVVTLSEYAFGVSGTLSNAVDVGLSFALGMQGNYLYKLHVQKKVRAITAMYTPEQADIELTRQGGTSIGAAIGFAVAALAIVYLIVIVGEKGAFAL